VRRGALAALVLSLATAAHGDVFVVTQPDGSLKIVNVPGMGGAGARVPDAPAARREQYWPQVQQTSKAHGVDPALVDLMIRMESGYNPKAVSPKGARGIMQLMPSTASMYGVKNVFDPGENLRGGIRYLRDLLERFGSNVTYALAAYNAGPEAVERHGGVPPYQETRNYVAAILGAYNGHGGGGGGLAGGFGKPVRATARPVALHETGGGTLVSNARRAGEPEFARKLALK
jgi:hypothetical protein